MCHNPTLYPQLCAYRSFIQVCAAKFTWPAVCSYDVRNRGKHSIHNSFDFHVIDHDIYITTMDASTARQNIRNCSGCKSIWHVLKDCPFSTAGPLAPATRQQTTQQSSQRQPAGSSNSRNASTQICFNWNAGRCVQNPCVRRHVCNGCGGQDPRPRCANCNSGTFGARPKQSQPPAQQQQSFPQSSGIQTAQGRVV